MEYLVRHNQRNKFESLGGVITEENNEYLVGYLHTYNKLLRLKLAVIFTPRLKLQRP